MPVKWVSWQQCVRRMRSPFAIGMPKIVSCESLLSQKAQRSSLFLQVTKHRLVDTSRRFGTTNPLDEIILSYFVELFLM